MVSFSEVRDMARHFGGDMSDELFDYYAMVNQHFFGDRLPPVFLIEAITPYGRCIGMTQSSDRLPVILMHKGVDSPAERFYTVLHEAIHVSCGYVLKEKQTGKRSHETASWLSEVNRIAPLLGYDNLTIAAPKNVRRPKAEGGGLTRIQPDPPYSCSFRFPHELPTQTGQPLPPVSRWSLVAL